MSPPVSRRLANPLSIWIALLAIVLQSVMPMVAQARVRALGSGEAQAHGVQIPGLPIHGLRIHAQEAHNHHSASTHAGLSQAAQASDDAGASAANPPANPHALHGDAPCPYCRVHLDAVALPVLPNPHWVMLVRIDPRTIRVEAMPALPDAWSPTRPRGPPLVS